MKVKHIQKELFESNESQMHSTILIGQMKVKHIQTNLFESDESQMHSTMLIESN